jgi:uncharacterized protein YjbJ (UPF0337 family)
MLVWLGPDKPWPPAQLTRPGRFPVTPISDNGRGGLKGAVKCNQEKVMKPSTTDQIQGKLHELKGKAKEKAGKVTNNPNLAADGQDEKIAGKVQKKVGQIEKVFEK